MRLNSQTGIEGLPVSSLNCDRPLHSGTGAPELESVPTVETDRRHSHVRRAMARSTSTVMTFAGKVGRTWVARDCVGVAYDRHDALKNEAAYARHYK